MTDTLAPTIETLHKMLDEAGDLWVYKRKPLISLAPKYRRRELVWAKFSTMPYVKKSDEVMANINPDHTPEKIHREIFLSPEAMASPTQDIALFLLHGMSHHQADAHILYHGPPQKRFLLKAGFPKEAIVSDKSYGWIPKMGDVPEDSPARDLLDGMVAQVAYGDFDIYKKPWEPMQGSGKMLLWYCSCPRPPKVRTGNPRLRVVCETCGEKVLLQDPKGNSLPFDTIPYEWRGERSRARSYALPS
jgi:hypothetical protein